jgi:hypothetical protein
MNNKLPTGEEILASTNEALKAEGISINEYSSPLEEVQKFLLPSMQNAKNTLAALYKFVPKQKFGVVGKLKNLILARLKNITLNVVERESMKQQKFNELTYQSIQNLTKEIEELKRKL